MSSNVKMVAAPSRFGVVMATMTVKTTLMKQTVVSLYFFCEHTQRQTDFYLMSTVFVSDRQTDPGYVCPTALLLLPSLPSYSDTYEPKRLSSIALSLSAAV